VPTDGGREPPDLSRPGLPFDRQNLSRGNMNGTELRMRRLFPNETRGLFAVPLDHSVTLGPIDGLASTDPLAQELVDAGADLLIVPPGAVRTVAPVLGPTTRLGVHLSASTSIGTTQHRKVRVASVDEAVGLGADLVSVQVNFGSPAEPEMIDALGRTAAECRRYGIPLLAMVYVVHPPPVSASEIQHAARAAADLGADVVKVPYPESLEGFAALVSTTPVPVLVGGGPKTDSEAEVLEMIPRIRRAGGAGICIGRKLFQHAPVGPLARQVAALLHSDRK
jgi:DhnA family fructose-bisphosphate aldolase class Ia